MADAAPARPSPPTTRFGMSSVDRPMPCIRCSYNLQGLRVEDVCPECSTPIATSCEAAFALAQHRSACRCCGYPLEGLPIDVRCPECAYPVEWSSNPHRLSHLTRAALNRLRGGMLVIFAGCTVLVVGGAWWLLHELRARSLGVGLSPFGLRGSITMWRLIDAAGASFIALGTALITHRSEPILKHAEDSRSRRVLHAGAFVGLLLSACWYVGWALYWHMYAFGPASIANRVAIKAAMLAVVALLMLGAALRARQLATFIPAPRLVVLGTATVWAAPAAIAAYPCVPVVPTLIAAALLGVQALLLARRIRRVEPLDPGGRAPQSHA